MVRRFGTVRTQRAEAIPNTNTDKRTPGAKASKASSRKMPQCIGDYEQWKERCHQRHVPSQRSHFSVPLSKHECTLLFAAHVATFPRSNVPCYVIHPSLGTICAVFVRRLAAMCRHSARTLYVPPPPHSTIRGRERSRLGRPVAAAARAPAVICRCCDSTAALREGVLSGRTVIASVTASVGALRRVIAHSV